MCHILSISENSSEEKLTRLNDIFENITGIRLCQYENHLDDFHIDADKKFMSVIEDEKIYAQISKKLGNILFTVHIINDNDFIFDYICYAGEIS